MIIATTTITVAEIANLMQGIATLNLGYLGLCVTIILFVGGFFYIFNFKPLQESIKKQEERLESTNNNVDSKIEKINNQFVGLVTTQTKELRTSIEKTSAEVAIMKKEASEKIGLAGKEILDFKKLAQQELKELREKYQQTELDAKWKEHYMWEGRKVHTNVIVSLIEYMELALKYNRPYLSDLWLERIIKTLNTIKVYDYEKDKQSVQSRLLTLLSKIKEDEVQINKAKELISKVFA